MDQKWSECLSRQLPGPPGAHTTQDREMDLDSDSDAEPVYQPASGIDEEGEFSDPDPDLTATDTDQAFSEEQTSGNCKGIRSFR